MALRHWFLFFGLFFAFTLPMAIGDASVQFAATNDLNNALGYQVDQISSGSGFLALPRNVVAFFGSTFMKWATFNYSYLTGDLEVVKRFFQLLFGGSFVVMLGLTLVGIVQRTF